jgi:hypothetical protein
MKPLSSNAAANSLTRYVREADANLLNLFPHFSRYFSAGILFLCLLHLPACLNAQTAPPVPATPPPANAVVLDRVVAVVNNQAILASDVDDEIRLAVLDPGQAGLGVLTPQRALEQLISRALIQQQIRQEDTEATEPTQAEIDARLSQIRKEVPACVHLNCASDEGWKAFLAAHELNPDRVRSYLRFRIQILRFIEERFRQGIRISPEEIESYYKQTLLPQYGAGEAAPILEEVAPRIQEILLQQQVNALFDGWLKNLRKQGDVEVLDPSLEAPQAPSGAELITPLPSQFPTGVSGPRGMKLPVAFVAANPQGMKLPIAYVAANPQGMKLPIAYVAANPPTCHVREADANSPNRFPKSPPHRHANRSNPGSSAILFLSSPPPAFSNPRGMKPLIVTPPANSLTRYVREADANLLKLFSPPSLHQLTNLSHPGPIAILFLSRARKETHERA